jgi:hypothetical protein
MGSFCAGGNNVAAWLVGGVGVVVVGVVVVVVALAMPSNHSSLLAWLYPI